MIYPTGLQSVMRQRRNLTMERQVRHANRDASRPHGSGLKHGPVATVPSRGELQARRGAGRVRMIEGLRSRASASTYGGTL